MVRRPLVVVAGRIQELPQGDSAYSNAKIPFTTAAGTATAISVATSGLSLVTSAGTQKYIPVQ